MTSTLWSDISEFNPDVNGQYPYRGIAIRSNDGTYKDHHFVYNLAWAKHACDTGRLDFFIVYLVWESNWRQTLQTFEDAVGKPHPKMAVMIDVESWPNSQGVPRYSGDYSASINDLRTAIVKWLRKSMPLLHRLIRPWRRVIGYGNVYDLENLWVNRPSRLRLVIAAYGSNPSFRGRFAHQFASDYNVPPFGPSDINSADGGLTSLQVAHLLGVGGTTLHKPKPKRRKVYVVRLGDTFDEIARRNHLTKEQLRKLNPQVKDPNVIFPGERIFLS